MPKEPTDKRPDARTPIWPMLAALLLVGSLEGPSAMAEFSVGAGLGVASFSRSPSDPSDTINSGLRVMGGLDIDLRVADSLRLGLSDTVTIQTGVVTSYSPEGLITGQDSLVLGTSLYLLRGTYEIGSLYFGPEAGVTWIHANINQDILNGAYGGIVGYDLYLGSDVSLSPELSLVATKTNGVSVTLTNAFLALKWWPGR